MRWPPTPLELGDAVALLVHEGFERDGFLAPVAFVFATRNPETERPIDPTLLTFAPAGVAAGFAAQLRAVARELDAIMLVQAYEVRMIGPLSDQPSRGFGSLEGHPDAKDYVVVFVEDRRSSSTRALLAPIRMGRRSTLGPFEHVHVDRVDGWLTALLPLVS
jgi:hypothetical protein